MKLVLSARRLGSLLGQAPPYSVFRSTVAVNPLAGMSIATQPPASTSQ